MGSGVAKLGTSVGTKVTPRIKSIQTWWAHNNDAIISSVSKSFKGVSLQKIMDLANAITPDQLQAGLDAAVAAYSKKFGKTPDENTTKIISALVQQIHATAQSTQAASASGGGGLSVDHVYRRAIRRNAGMTGGFDVDGACGTCDCKGYIGSDELNIDTVRDYGNSINSSTKNELMKDIIGIADRLALPTKGENIGQQINTLVANMPTGARFAKSSEAHKEACTRMANAINKTYGNPVIDMSLGPEVICQQVAEIVHSLGVGMHSEFLAVYNDVKRIIKNLHVLKQTMKDTHERIIAKIKASEDPSLAQEIVTLDDLHNILTTELERQISLLTNLLNVTLLPAEKTLADLLKTKEDVLGYIDKIDIKLGTDRFGKVIADILKGLGVTAGLAKVIDGALKQVGLTMDDYARETSASKLREKITQNMMGKKLSPTDLGHYLDSAKILYKNLYRHKEIASAYKSGRGEHGDVHGDNIGLGDPYASATDGGFHQGVAHTSSHALGGHDGSYNKTTTDRRVSDRRKLRDLIFDAFHKQLTDYFDAFVAALDTLTAKVGQEIPLSEQLNSFRHVLGKIDETLVYKKDIYYALIGYFNDAMSKSLKDEFVGQMQMIRSTVESITEMPMYSASKHYFVAVAEKVKNITGLIDKYTEEISSKFGQGENASDASQHVGTLGANEVDGGDCGTFSGSDESMTDGAFDFPDAVFGGNHNPDGGKEFAPSYKYRSTKTIHEAIRQFDNKYAKARILGNLAASSGELKHYAESYEKLVANSVATILREEKTRYENLAKALDETTTEAVTIDNIAEFKTPDMANKQRDAAKKFLKERWEVKKRFWATAEAVETYMRTFTDAITRNPNDVKAMKAMLDDVEVIADWYDDKTGDKLASVFDTFPGGDDNKDGDSYNAFPDGLVKDSTSDHYYKRVAAGGKRPGNPYMVVDPVRGLRACGRAEQMLASMSALKNLLSIFVHIGSTFGGQELRKGVFMTPTQMYKNLNEYLCASAFAQGFGAGEPNCPMPAEFENTANSVVVFDTKTDNVTRYSGDERGSIASADTTPYQHHSVALGIRSALHSAPVTFADMLKGGVDVAKNGKYHQFMKRWGIWMRPTNRDLAKAEGFGFKREDEYFILILKSIAAKILTVTSLYDVLDRPTEFHGLTAIRMILGGSGETPKVIKEAVPLYMRLLLLATFYRGIFGFDGPEAGEEYDKNKFAEYKDLPQKHKNVKISMVPDVDGVFAGLIRLVFRRTRYVEAHAYSEEDIKDIVREVNLIYQRLHTKHPQNTVMEIINEFVLEINRRYGVVSKEDRDKYESEFGYQYGYSRLGTENRYAEDEPANIAILPGETEDEIELPSAAQRLLGETFETKEKKSSFKITTDHRSLVYNFRCAIDKYFSGDSEHFTFAHAIKTAQTRLDTETNDDARLKIVASLIRGVDINTKVDGAKYLLFHETVVAGLNALSGLHSMLTRFKRRTLLISLEDIEGMIWDYFSTEGPKRLSRRNPASADGSIVDYICEEFKRMGIHDEADSQFVDLVEKILGRDEAHPANGGHNMTPFQMKGIDGVAAYSGTTATNTWKWHSQDGTRDGVFVIGKPTNDAFHNKNEPSFSRSLVAADEPRLTNSDSFIYGLSGLLMGYSANTLRKARKSPTLTEEKKVADTFMRFIFNREFVMKELLETLFGLSCDFQSLVEVKIENDHLYMNCGGLKTLIEELFRGVSYFLDLLRPHIGKEILKKYTEKAIPGSYHWLQEQLMEKIIVGRHPSHINLSGEKNLRVGYASLDSLMQKLSQTYHCLTKQYDIDGEGLTGTVIGTSIIGKHYVTHEAKSRTSYDKVFAEMLFYDASRPTSGLISSSEARETTAAHDARDGVKVVDFLKNHYDSMMFYQSGLFRVVDTRYVARFHQLYTWGEEFTLNRSVLYAFNQLIAKFIQCFHDRTSGKIYLGLISTFANGPFNRAMTDQLQTYPDTVPMWFSKSSQKTDFHVPSGDVVASRIRDSDTAAEIPLLAQIIAAFLEVGINPNQSPQDRARMLSIEYTPLQGLIPDDALARDGTDATINHTPKIFVYLIACVIGFVARATFEALEKAATADNDKTKRRLLTAPGVKLTGMPPLKLENGWETYGEIKRQYTRSGGIPTAQEIIRKWLHRGGIDAVIRQLNYLSEWSPAVGDLQDVFLPRWVTAGAPYPQALKVIKILRMTEKNIPLEGNEEQSWGSAIRLASRVFPFHQDAIGRSAQDLAFRSKLFAGILARIYDDQIFANSTMIESGDAFTDKLSGSIEEDALSNKSVYSPSTAGASYVAKYDDLVNANITGEGSVQQASPDSGVLVYANNQSTDFGDHPMSKLGVSGTSRVANASDDSSSSHEYGSRMDPDGEHVLFTSLSVILKNLMQNRNQTNQCLINVFENIADVPVYMKEKILANLPAFRNLFQELINRCEFLKKFINDSNMDLSRTFKAGKHRATHNPWPWVLKAADNVSNANTKLRFTGIIEAIVRGCSAFTTSCEQVIREIGDDPKYLETQKNSIKDYKTQYGVNPFMPLSSTLAIFRNTTAENYMDFFPIHSLGKDQFKFAYGTRSLLAQPKSIPNLDHAPGMGDIITMFNSASDSRTQVDKRRADEFLKSFVSAMRYMFELKHIKGMLTPYVYGNVPSLTSSGVNTMIGKRGPYVMGSFVRDDLVLTDYRYSDGSTKRTAPPGTGTSGIHNDYMPDRLTNRADVSIVVSAEKIPAHASPAFAISKPFADVLKLTESSSREDQMKLVIEHISSKTGKPANLELQNIVDLGIVPISVHGLMRGIPFANLYNYGYTFDRFIINLYYNLDNAAAKDRIMALCDYDDNNAVTHRGQLKSVTSAKDMLVALLLDPYMSVSADGYEKYEKYVKSMLLGAASNGELGRPKFMSDQLYEKVLFGELYSSQNEYSELGPVSDAVRGARLSDDQLAVLLVELLGDLTTKIIFTPETRWVGKILSRKGVLVNPAARAFYGLAADLVVRNPKSTLPILAGKMKKLADSFDKDIFASNDEAGLTNASGWIIIAATLLCEPLRWFAENPKNRYKGTSRMLESTTSLLGVIGGPRSGPYGLKAGTLLKALKAGLTVDPNEEMPAIFPSIMETIYDKLASPPAGTFEVNNSPMPEITAGEYAQLLNKSIYAKRDSTRSFGSEKYTRRGSLHWIKKDTGDGEMNPANIDSAEIPDALVPILGILGPLRFNTVLIRNLIFIINLVRSIRLKMNRDLAYSRDIVIKSQPVARTRLTEFFGNETEHGRADRRPSEYKNELYDY